MTLLWDMLLCIIFLALYGLLLYALWRSGE